MIIDTSALIAVLQGEPQSDAIVAALENARRPAISAATLLEASVVADGTRDPVRSARFDALIDAIDPEVVPVTREHVRIARQAFRDFGRGSGHAARLNFGDCFAYALATERRERLLYVGDDFAHTDLTSALG
jgi:ribonuclease VapC